MNKSSGITRPDLSKNDLNRYKSMGYATVVFVANLAADPQCEQHNGSIYSIDELLTLDNPIYRISHPNCRCKFDPYGKSKQTAPTTQTTQPQQTTQQPQQGQQPGPNETGQPTGLEKNPWYKRWMPWLFDKKKSNYRQNILRRAYLLEKANELSRTKKS